MVYSFSLNEAFIPAQSDTDVRETTVGSLLRDTAAAHPDAPALTEIDMAGQAQRRWTYADLLENAERLAALAERLGRDSIFWDVLETVRRHWRQNPGGGALDIQA